MGYAFINFIDPLDIPKFYQQFHDQKWAHYNSEKVGWEQLTHYRSVIYATHGFRAARR